MTDPSPAASKPLLLSRRFAPLFWCQFFSAFSDNFLKNALVFLILFKIGGSAAESLITLAAAVFIAPIFFLSAFGGEMADRYDKAVVAQRLKLCEIGVSIVAIIGFIIHSVPLLFVALFAFGVIGSQFGPIKYGILPDLLDKSELPAANALVEGATFMAILLGTIVGGMAAKDGGDPSHFAGAMLVCALLCWGSSLLIPKVGSGAPDLKISVNIISSTGRLLRHLRDDRRLWWGALVTSWFWLVGAVVLSLLPPLVKTVLGGTEEVVTMFLAVFSVAVAVGSGLAAWLSAGRIVILPTLVGAIGLACFAIDLGWTTYGTPLALVPAGVGEVFGSSRGLRVMIDLAGLAISGGLYIVPTFAAVQAWAGADRRARVIAGVNVLNAAFMVGGTIVIAALQAFHVSTPVLFMLIGLATFGVAFLVARTMPANAMMDFLSILFRVLYRVELRGVENLDRAGQNPIIALNHTSFLDASLALSLLPRDPVFAIDSAMAQHWWVKPFLRFTRAMPLDPTKPMATRTLINAVKSGEPLIIFPEGRLTVTGSLMKIYDGAGLIADKTDAFVVPVRLEGLDLDAVHAAAQIADSPPLVPQGHRDCAGAGEADRRPRAERQAPAHGRRRGALRDHVEPRVPHHLDRTDRDGGADRGGGGARHGPCRGRGPGVGHASARSACPRAPAASTSRRGCAHPSAACDRSPCPTPGPRPRHGPCRAPPPPRSAPPSRSVRSRWCGTRGST